MVDLWRDFWIHETGTGQQVAQLHDRYVWWTRGRRSKQVLDDLKETTGYWKLKQAAVRRTLWRARFGRGCGPAVRQTDRLQDERTNEWKISPAVCHQNHTGLFLTPCTFRRNSRVIIPWSFQRWSDLFFGQKVGGGGTRNILRSTETKRTAKFAVFRAPSHWQIWSTLVQQWPRGTQVPLCFSDRCHWHGTDITSYQPVPSLNAYWHLAAKWKNVSEILQQK